MPWIKLFFINNKSDLKQIITQIKNDKSNFKIFCNDSKFVQSEQNENIKIKLLDEEIKDESREGKRIFKESESYLKKLSNKFLNIQYEECKPFLNIEYFILLRIFFLLKIKEIFNKNENIIFIFNEYKPLFLSIVNIAKLQKYNIKKIAIIENNKEKIIKIDSIDFKNLDKKSRLYSKKNISTLISLGIKMSMMISKKIQIKFRKILGENEMDNLKKSVIKKLHTIKNRKIMFAISTTRKDLYFDQWNIIYKKLLEEKTDAFFISSDFSTLRIIENENVKNISIAEEVRLMAQIIKNSQNGKNIRKNVENILDEFFILKKIEKEILDVIFRAIAMELIIKIMLEQTNLTSIIACSEGSLFETVVINKAKTSNIPTFTMTPTFLHFNPFFSKWFKSDKIFCFTQKDKQVLEKMEYSKNRICVSGNVKHEYFVDSEFESVKKKFFKENNFDTNKKNILIMMSEWHHNDLEWMKDIIEFAGNNSAQVIIKIHPKYKNDDQKKIRLFSENINEKYKNICKIFLDESPTLLISISDIFITDYSNAAYDALFFKKIIFNVNLNFNERNIDKIYYPLVEEKISLFVIDIQILKNHILEILENSNPNYLKRIDEGFKKYFDNTDSPSKIILDKITHIK